MPPSVRMTVLSQDEATAIARVAQRRIEIAALDLTGHVVITEAATGAYAVTAAAASAAGAHVYALASDTAYGTAVEATIDVSMILEKLGAPIDSVHFVTDKDALPIERATIVTNSGVVRPIDESFIKRLPASATIALMFEAWEARTKDIEYEAAWSRGIEVIGVDEHHPVCDAFGYVGDLALYGFRSRQWPLRGTKVVVFSDNLFAGPVIEALTAHGADATVTNVPTAATLRADVAVVAMTPNAVARSDVDATELSRAVVAAAPYGCVQLWGDLDRAALDTAGIEVVPRTEPPRGHQGIPMTAAGHEAVVRLQIGGLAAVHHRLASPESPFYGLAQPLHRTDWSQQ